MVNVYRRQFPPPEKETGQQLKITPSPEKLLLGVFSHIYFQMRSKVYPANLITHTCIIKFHYSKDNPWKLLSKDIPFLERRTSRKTSLTLHAPTLISSFKKGYILDEKLGSGIIQPSQYFHPTRQSQSQTTRIILEMETFSKNFPA